MIDRDRERQMEREREIEWRGKQDKVCVSEHTIRTDDMIRYDILGSHTFSESTACRTGLHIVLEYAKYFLRRACSIGLGPSSWSGNPIKCFFPRLLSWSFSFSLSSSSPSDITSPKEMKVRRNKVISYYKSSYFLNQNDKVKKSKSWRQL